MRRRAIFWEGRGLQLESYLAGSTVSLDGLPGFAWAVLFDNKLIKNDGLNSNGYCFYHSYRVLWWSQNPCISCLALLSNGGQGKNESQNIEFAYKTITVHSMSSSSPADSSTLC